VDKGSNSISLLKIRKEKRTIIIIIIIIVSNSIIHHIYKPKTLNKHLIIQCEKVNPIVQRKRKKKDYYPMESC
jgi:hypothetical protein